MSACVERIQVAKPPSIRGGYMINADGGYLSHVDGDPRPTPEHYWVRYSKVGFDVLKKFEHAKD